MTKFEAEVRKFYTNNYGTIGAFKEDLYDTLVLAPREARFILKQLRKGLIDGATYNAEPDAKGRPCACLVGTIAMARREEISGFEPGFRGIPMDPYRPTEAWFSKISPGNTPLNNLHARVAADLIEEFVRSNPKACP